MGEWRAKEEIYPSGVKQGERRVTAAESHTWGSWRESSDTGTKQPCFHWAWSPSYFLFYVSSLSSSMTIVHILPRPAMTFPVSEWSMPGPHPVWHEDSSGLWVTACSWQHPLLPLSQNNPSGWWYRACPAQCWSKRERAEGMWQITTCGQKVTFLTWK